MGTISDWMAIFIPLALVFAGVIVTGRAMVAQRHRAADRRRREVDALRLGERG